MFLWLYPILTPGDPDLEILSRSPYRTRSGTTAHGAQGKQRRMSNRGDAQEASNVLGFWDTNHTIDREEQHAYLHGHRLEEKATAIGYWATRRHW